MNSKFGVIELCLLGIILVSILVYIIRRLPEKSATLTAVGIFMTFGIGLTFTLLVPSFNRNWSVNTGQDLALYHAVYSKAEMAKDERQGLPFRQLTLQEANQIQAQDPEDLAGYTPLEARGRLVYQREGCMYCHSQQIRPLDGEIKRYSLGSTGASLVPVADEREYDWDQPHFLGTRRIGPDLSRVGGKYSDDWHYSHFYFPRQMVPGSIMPAFTWLFKVANPTDPSSPPVPTDDCRALVAYVQTLGFNRQIWDQPFKRDPKTGAYLKDAQGNLIPDGPARWRRWLDPADQLETQSIGESQVLRADVSAGGGKGGQVRGHDILSPANRIPPKSVTKE